MSLVTDSPVHSSSSDDFAAIIDAELENLLSASSSSSEEDEVDFDPESERIKRRKVEYSESIEQPLASTSNGFLEEMPEASTKKYSCAHRGTWKGLCFDCGLKVDDESGVTLGYVAAEFRVGEGYIDQLRDEGMKLLRQKKLFLVLDLDHTLLNSTALKDLTPEEEYLKSQTDSFQGSLFMLDSMPLMTKLRPFVRSFLEEASKLFEMYIYTMGDRPYASQMAKLLDPENKYFSSRVISRDESTQRHQKDLDLLLGKASAILILDDTESAWPGCKDNLILMERYNFFASSCRQFGFNCKSLSEQRTDEDETDGALATVLKMLRQIHDAFFDEIGNDLASRDVRQILKTIRQEVLKGCKIVFSRIFSTSAQPDNHPLWRIAEQLGATCTTKLDESVTHVVSTDSGTEKSRWAVREKKFLVHPGWIEASNYLWKRQPEENHTVNKGKNQT